ncbi:MAG: hypothetical protein M3384_06770 [Acidobacteriota bacterium]|nr:hypothetical protein [Acidobacteriota bacterium]
MTEEVKTGATEEQSREPFWGSSFWFPLLFILSSSIFRRFVPSFAAWLLASGVTACVGYFTLPKPRPGFIRFFLYAQALMAVALAALRLVPGLLAGFMPEFWAYSLPAFLLFGAIYFVPPLDESRAGGRGAWWKWLLCSLLIAGLYGWIISFSV